MPGLLIGGEQIKKEKEKIRKGVNIIVGTPGKVLYHMKNSSNLRFETCSSLILEEADQMLQIGFEKELNEIISIVKNKAERLQFILVSATVND